MIHTIAIIDGDKIEYINNSENLQLKDIINELRVPLFEFTPLNIFSFISQIEEILNEYAPQMVDPNNINDKNLAFLLNDIRADMDMYKFLLEEYINHNTKFMNAKTVNALHLSSQGISSLILL